MAMVFLQRHCRCHPALVFPTIPIPRQHCYSSSITPQHRSHSDWPLIAQTASSRTASANRKLISGRRGFGTVTSASKSVDEMNGDGGRAREAFEQLKTKLKEISCLEGVQSLLSWDQAVNMPPNGVAMRGDQLGVIARVVHEHKTSDAIRESLAVLLSNPLEGFTPAEIASVREANREYTRTKKMPVGLAARAAALQATGGACWQKARKESDFALFAPVLQEWVDIAKEEAAAVAEPGTNLYDYCLDKFERGLTAQRLEPLFASIKTPLVALVKRIQQTTTTSSHDHLLSGVELSVDTQKVIARRFAEEIGFDFASGRFDDSTHPMTIAVGSPFDVRITSRFRETEMSSGLLATLHEAGHGLYEQGRNVEACKDGLPVSKPPGMGLHESQSLLWEKQVGMSAEFWDHYWPVVVSSFAGSLNPSIEASEYHKLINEVKPGMIRVEADELSYPLHILLRFEIEKGLLDGSVKVADVPALWNQKMEEYLGIVPKNDTEGCLQDIHWSYGLFGYFPTYTLGAVYASMLFQAAEKQIPGLRKHIQEGKFSPLREWLRQNIHAVGSLYETADELIEQVTGSKLDAACFLAYLSRKYGALYNLELQESNAVAR